MKSAASLRISLLLVFLITGCEEDMGDLADSSQIQATLFLDLASEFAGDKHGVPESRPLFLCYGDPMADPPVRVLELVTRKFPYSRPHSALVHEGDTGIPIERDTGLRGIELRLAPFDVEGSDSVTVDAGYFVTPMHAKHFKYRLEKIRHRWKILSRDLVSVS